jgi:hypothetical protein
MVVVGVVEADNSSSRIIMSMRRNRNNSLRRVGRRGGDGIGWSE